jgi:hypothetical protein
MSSSRNDPVFASVMTASLYERADDVRCSSYGICGWWLRCPETASVMRDAFRDRRTTGFHGSAPCIPTVVFSGSMACVWGNGRVDEPATDGC